MADQVPPDWQNKVMHGSLTIGELVLMGGDVAPDSYEQPKGFSLSIAIERYQRRRTDFSRAGGGRQRDAPARAYVLGRAFRHGRRSVRDPVDD